MELGQLMGGPLLVIKDVMLVNIHLSSIILCLLCAHTTAHMAYFEVFGNLFTIFYLVFFSVKIKVKCCIVEQQCFKRLKVVLRCSVQMR